eukprot:TRINITY_DN16269_c0_g1_i1.p1 TRINITY_DN16269_c0_g1~~TRINITY_DN16269_c0_g1_i1.p1  ORF type:complete len:105 (-),score=7.47 TRINITY_DN16269_c0_g1_i1:116-430(-)
MRGWGRSSRTFPCHVMSSYAEQSSFGHRHPSGHDATWPSDRVRGVHPTGLSTSDMDGASSCGHYAHPDIKPCGADIYSSLKLVQGSGTRSPGVVLDERGSMYQV